MADIVRNLHQGHGKRVQRARCVDERILGRLRREMVIGLAEVYAG